MKITDTTALNVLVNHAKEGADESAFFHSKVYNVKDTIHRLRYKGYRIQERSSLIANNVREMKYFVDLDQVRERALMRRGKYGRKTP